MLVRLPNFLDEDVPNGKTDLENELVKEWGIIPNFSFDPLDHVDLGEKIKQLDFKTGAQFNAYNQIGFGT